MIGSVITWSARNTFLVLLATAFIIFAGIYAVRHTALDAIPDLSDTQVIVYTEYPGQAPQVIEDQVTYPLTTALLAVPRSKVVRGFSFFGVSFVYVVFEDGTDLYWARSRVLEYLNFAAKRLPEGITPSLGPDATGVGWVYQYVVLGAQRTLAELRTIQDWYLRYQLTKAEGVAEVASVGGFVQQYQVVVDPQKLQAYGLTLSQLTSAIRASNRDVGGRVVEMSETEYVVRGHGYLRNTGDLEQQNAGRHASAAARRGAHRARTRRAPRHRRAQRPGRGGQRNRAAARRAERAARDRQRQAEARRNRPFPAARGEGRSGL
jgi:Cu(I)/Ag(I) efflux system membrane protein CusA/SilA